MMANEDVGTVVTFYSFKGGVGRTQALTNTAVVLARWGYRVLALDWDLEAPGMFEFFRPYVSQAPIGLPELLQSGQRLSETWRTGVRAVRVPGTLDRLFTIASDPHTGSLVEMTQALDWTRLFAEGFGADLQDSTEQWRSEYDFVLVDSRTGVTDIGAVCTAQLPDIVVLLSAANMQSLDGIRTIAAAAESARELLPLDLPGLLFLPIAARYESTVEVQLAREWLITMEGYFGPLMEPWRPSNLSVTELMSHLRIPYVPRWSYGEELPVVREASEDASTISWAFEGLAALLAHRLTDTQLLVTTREAFVASSKAPTKRGGPQLKRAYDVFLSYAAEDGETALRIIDELQRRGYRVWGGTASSSGLPEQAAALRDSENMVALISGVPSLAQTEEYRQYLLQSLLETPTLGARIVPVMLTTPAQLPPLLQGYYAVDALGQSPSEIARSIVETLSGSERPSANPNVELEEWFALAIDRWQRLLTSSPEATRNLFQNGYWAVGYALLGPVIDLPLGELLLALRDSSRDLSGWPPWVVLDKPELEPYAADGMIECWLRDNKWGDAAHSDYWLARPDGKFFLLRGYQEDSEARGLEPGSFLDLTIPALRAGEVLLHAARMSARLSDLATPVGFKFHWSGLGDRELRAWARPSRDVRERRSRTEVVESRLVRTGSEIRQSLTDSVAAAVRPLYEAFEFFELPSFVITEELAKLRLADQMGEHSNVPLDSEPGMLDILAEGEEAFPRAGQRLARIAELTNQLSERMTSATSDIHVSDSEGKGFAGRLAITRSLATHMELISRELDFAATEYADDLARVDPAIRTLLGMLERDPSSAQGEPSVMGFLDSIPVLADVSQNSIASASQLVEAMEPLAEASREVREPVRRIQQALKRIADASSVTADWAARRAALPF